MTQKLVKLKKKSLIVMIVISILLHKNLLKFAARLAQAKLAIKADIADFIKRQNM